VKYLLDTNICIFLMKNLPEVVEKRQKNRQLGIAVSSITIAELLFGVYKSDRIEKNEIALSQFLTEVEEIVFDSNAADSYGRIKAHLQRQGTPIGNMDTLIAAQALTSGLILVTNNTREFERVPKLVIEDWKQNS